MMRPLPAALSAFLLTSVFVLCSAEAQPIGIQIGDVVAGDVIDPVMPVVYEFDALPGERIFADRITTSNNAGLNWRIEDRFGRVLAADNNSLDDLGVMSLVGGRYTVTVESESTGTGSFEFQLAPSDDVVAAATVGDTIVGTTTAPGQAHGYTFDTTAGQRLFIDYLTSSHANRMGFEVVDDLGRVLLSRTSSLSDSGPFVADGLPITVWVRPEADFVPSFEFAVVEVTDAAPQAISIGDTIAGTLLSPAGQATFTFDSTVGQTVFVDALVTRNRLNWMLEDAAGRTIISRTSALSDLGPITLAGGTNTLTILGEGDAADDFMFTLVNVPTTSQTIAPDELVSGSIDVPGGTALYELDILTTTRIGVDQSATTNNGGLNFRLRDQHGRDIVPRTANLGDFGPVDLLPGTYELAVLGEGDATGSWSFTVVDVADSTTAANVGDSIADGIDVPFERDAYTFSASAGMLLSIDTTATSNNGGLNYLLEDAAGRVIVSRTANLNDIVDVPLVGGSYTLTVIGEGAATGSYAFDLVDAGTSSFTPAGTAITLDSVVAGDINPSGETDSYTFTLGETTTVFIDLLNGGSNLRWTLSDPAGRELFTNTRASNVISENRGPFVLVAGTYTLSLTSVNSATPTYEFNVLSVDDTLSSVAVSEVVTGQITPGQRQTFDLTLAARTRLFLDLQTGGSQLRWRLIDPAGDEVFPRQQASNPATQNRGPFTLEPGTYCLVIDAQNDYTPTFSFAFVPVTDEMSTHTLGTTETSTIPSPGGTQRFSFDVAATTSVVFDLLQGSRDVQWRLYDPADQVVFDVRADNTSNDDQGPIALAPGTWTIEMASRDGATPNWSFATVVVAADQVSVANLDDVLNDAFDTLGQRHIYTFDLAAPTPAYFDVRTASTNVMAKLTTPGGDVVFDNPNLNSTTADDRGPWTLPAGEVTLELVVNSGTAVSYDVSLVAVGDTVGTIEVGEIVRSGIPTPGATATYDLDIEVDGQTVVFDVMQSSSGLTWSVIDSAGQPIFSNLNATNPGTHDRGPFSLAAGSYQIELDGTNSGTPSFVFRVRDEAPVLPPPGCAACGALEIVFVFDTSASMVAEATQVCDLATDIVAGLAAYGIPVTAEFWGITDMAVIPCVTDTVLNALGPDVPGNVPPELSQLDMCPDGVNGFQENWALASAIVAERYSWTDDTVRLVIPVADEGAVCGDPVDAYEDLGVDASVDVAIGSDVVVSPIIPSNVGDPVIIGAVLLAQGTGGEATVASFDPAELADTIAAIGASACSTETEVVRPTLTNVQPPDGTTVVAGTTLTITGQVMGVNALRPVIGVVINGEPADSIDVAGRFFSSVTIDEGVNEIRLELVEDCGSSPETITLIGVTDPAGGANVLADVSADLGVDFANTTFHDTEGRLLVDALVTNDGSSAVEGPVYLAVGTQLDARVSLANAVGQSPLSEPWVIVVPDGDVIESGQTAPAVTLLFDNPAEVPVRFVPRLFAPENRAPLFTSTPTTTAPPNALWAYDADAIDADGHDVTYSLATAPTGMTIDDTSGLVMWTPSPADNGGHDVSVVASDGRGGVATQRFTLLVGSENNRPPVFVSAPVTSVGTGGVYNYQAEGWDPDGDVLTFALEEGPTGMTSTAQGLLSWDFALPGLHDVVLRLSDGNGGQVEQQWTLAVGEVPANPGAPVVTSIPPVIAAVDALWVYQPVASDPDGDVLVWSLDDAPAGVAINGTTGRLTWTPGDAQVGDHTFALTVRDGRGGQSTQTFTVTVLSERPNLPPQFVSSPPGFAVVGDPYQFQLEALDPELGSLTYTLMAGPVGMSVSENGAVDWTPQVGDIGPVAVAVTAADDLGAVSTQVWVIEVRGDNQGPSIDTTAPLSIIAGQIYTYRVGASDPDGDPLTFSLATAPVGMTINRRSGLVTWQPLNADAGDHPVTVEVSDCCGETDAQTFDLTVVADNEPPSIAFNLSSPRCFGEPVSVCIGVSDNVGVVARTLELDGNDVPLDTVGCTTVTRDIATTVEAVATATDVNDNVGTTTMDIAIVDCNDPEAPVVTLHSPTAESAIFGPTEIVASITDNNPAALSWEVAIAPMGSTDFEVIGLGTGEVNEDGVAVFDPTLLPNGTWVVQIVGNDGVQTGGIEFHYDVAGDFKLGNFSVTFVDLVVPVAGIPLTVTRTYDSLETVGRPPGDFGVGWRLGLSGEVSDTAEEIESDIGLVALLGDEPFTLSSRVTVTRPDGRRVGFTFAPEQRSGPTGFTWQVAFEPDPGVEDELYAVDENDVVFGYGGQFFDFVIPFNPERYELVTKEGVRYVIDENEGLQHVVDVAGNTLDVTPDGIVSSTGVSLTFARDAQGRITTITEPDDPDDPDPPGELDYVYDGSGNLVAFRDQLDNEVAYEYGEPAFENHLTAIVDPLDRPILRTAWHPDGRIAGYCGPDGNIDTLEGCARLDHDVLDGQQTVVDARGRRTERFFDDRGNLVLERQLRDDFSFLELVYDYDDQDRVIRFVTPTGAEFLRAYDERGNITSFTDGRGGTFAATYDPACNRLTESIGPEGQTERRQYDDECNMTRVIDALGGETTYTYDDIGNLTSTTDANDNTWTIGYENGLPSSVTDPLGRTTTYERNIYGEVLYQIGRDGRRIDFDYDEAHRPVMETWDTVPPRVTTYEYNAAGQVTRAASPDAVVTLEYWPDGRVRSDSNAATPGAPELEVRYETEGGERGLDGNGNVTSIVDNKDGVTEYVLDDFERLVGATQTVSGVERSIEMDWNDDFVPTAIRRFEATSLVASTTFGYDCAACSHGLTSLTHNDGGGALLHDILLTRNLTGRVTSMTDGDGTHTFTYDALGRLLDATRPAGLPNETYRYDGESNRTSSHLSASYTYSADEGDGGEQLRATDDWTMTWDDDGRLLTQTAGDGTTLTYQWDHRGRLIQVDRTGPAGPRTLAFTYDPLNRRVATTVDGVTTWTAWDGDNPHLDVDESGAVVRRYFNGRELDEVWAVETSEGTGWLLTDHVRSVRDVYRGGAVTDQLTYDSFGQVLDRTGTTAGLPTFNSRPFDAELGLGFYRARVYSPEMGRFLSEDPLSPYGYAYANNQPTFLLDPTGESVAIEYACLAVNAFNAGVSFGTNIALPVYAIFKGVADALMGIQPPPGLANGLGKGIGGYAGGLAGLPPGPGGSPDDWANWAFGKLLTGACAGNNPQGSPGSGPPPVLFPSP